MNHRVLIATIHVLAAGAGLPAQSVLFSQRGADDDQMGRAVADLGDVDLDGVPDHAVAAPRDAVSPAGPGRVVVHSGRWGTPLFTVAAAVADNGFGAAVRGCGDLDGDGRPDFLVGAPGDDSAGIDAGAAFAFSGLDGSLLRTLTPPYAGEHFGHSVSGVGDTNGSGTPDLLVGAPMAAGGGAAYLIEGSDGTVLFRFGGDLGDTRFGHCVRELGDDADGDGHPDFLIAAPGGRTFVHHDLTGYVRLMSGHSGRILWTFFGTAVGAAAGTDVSSTGDLDGDGIRDVLVGMPGLSPSGVAAAGAALVYSSRTGAYLRSYAGLRRGDRLGTLVAGLGDLDGDGDGDLALGEGRSTNPQATVRSSRSGAVLFTVPKLTGDLQPYVLESAGDIDGDGRGDLLAGWSNSWNGSDRGVLHVVSGTGRTLTADVHTVRVRTTDRQGLVLRAGSEHAGKQYVVVGSMSGASPGLRLGSVTIPLNYDAYFDLLVQLPNTVVTNSVGTLDTAGNASAAFAYASSMLLSMAGLRFDHAYVVLGPGATVDMASNAVPLTALLRF